MINRVNFQAIWSSHCKTKNFINICYNMSCIDSDDHFSQLSVKEFRLNSVKELKICYQNNVKVNIIYWHLVSSHGIVQFAQ